METEGVGLIEITVCVGEVLCVDVILGIEVGTMVEVAKGFVGSLLIVGEPFVEISLGDVIGILEGSWEQQAKPATMTSRSMN